LRPGSFKIKNPGRKRPGYFIMLLKNIKSSKIVLMVMDLLFVATDGRMPSQNDMDVVFGAENNKSISVNAIFETTPLLH
jgi:hypothetical protein